MCGIAGFLYKQPPADSDIGDVLLPMLDVLGSRGVDGTGIAFYHQNPCEGLIARVYLGGRGTPDEQAQRVLARVGALGRVQQSAIQQDYLRFEINYKGSPAELANAIEHGDRGVQVFSLGNRLEIVKRDGDASSLREHFGLDHFRGSHGIGHTRLATESRVDVAHCHPFWARPFPDIAVVHNGQLTNYHKLRRIYEMQGYHFCTENDSEFIALYLAHKLADGVSLEDAMHQSLEDLDGTYTYVVSTPSGIGLAKDSFATKPMVLAETDKWVALASEEVALRRAIHEPFETEEPSARTVRVWLRPGVGAERQPVGAGR